MSHKYKILALDLDGTLTNSKKEITKPTHDALIKMQEMGYKVVLASGRPTPGMMDLARQLDLAKYGSYILSYNGAKITNCATDEIIYQQTLPTKYIKELYDFSRKKHIGLITYDETGVISATNTDQFMELEAKINHLELRKVENFVDYVTFPVNKCLMTGDGDYLQEVEKELQQKYESKLSVYRSEPFFLEAMPLNIDKAASLDRLLQSLGLTKDELVACGDGYNDMSMIQFAGLGVAMANAQPEVKESADIITTSNDEDGVLKIIEKYFL